MLVDDYLENCNVFLACGNSRANQEFPQSLNLEGEIGVEWAETTSTGLATFVFENPAEKDASELDCSYVFDASFTQAGCFNVGTGGAATMSQICDGSYADCSVMSAMCTVASFSTDVRMTAAFGAGSIPEMDYGSCTPCNCDPIAALLGKAPQVAGQVDGRDFLGDASHQLAGITTISGVISLIDAYLEPNSPIFPASLSPGRKAMTKEVSNTIAPMDMTDSTTILRIFEAAVAFWEEDGGTRRLQSGAKQEELAALIGELVTWYAEALPEDPSMVGKVNLANTFGASRDSLIKSVIDEDDLSTIDMNGVIETASTTIPMYTASPTASPTFEGGLDPGPGGKKNREGAIIGGVVGGIGGAALLCLLAFLLLKGKQESEEQNQKDTFNSMVTIVDDNRSTAITPGSDGSAYEGMRLAEMTHDDLPSATI